MKRKHIIIIMVLLSSWLAMGCMARTAISQMVVISDPHLLSPELVTPGSAIANADAGESKMMTMSDYIMAALTDSIINLKPQVVLITGDLTHNGERASHERMAHYLNRMAAHGIHPLVIPGNHDCNNPYSMRFDGDKTLPVPTITREEFASIYHDYGYGNGVVRDQASLSYCCEPIKGVVIIGIDSNMDASNTLVSRGDSVNAYHNGGLIKPETLQWVIDQADKARRKGKNVIAMMHHHLVPHFDHEERLLTNYIVQNHHEIAQQLMQAGIHTVFTGHLHVTDATTLYNNEHTDSIIEIATGSAICYPFALRTVTVDPRHHQLTVATRWLNATPECPTLRETGRQRIINATPGMATMLTNKAWNKVGNRMGQLKKMLEVGGGKTNLPETPQQATQLVLRHLNEVLSRAMIAVVEGNEQEKDVDELMNMGKEGVRAIIDETAPNQADALWEFFLADVYPKLEPLVRSILQDLNGVGTRGESRTDDLQLKARM